MNPSDIDEGKFSMDISEIPESDIIPCVAEKEAEMNEVREGDGKCRFEVDFDSFEQDFGRTTLYADCHLLCRMCNQRVDLREEEQVERGLCEVCVTFETPKLIEQFQDEFRPKESM